MLCAASSLSNHSHHLISFMSQIVVKSPEADALHTDAAML
jgi:hypothetical protein